MLFAAISFALFDFLHAATDQKWVERSVKIFLISADEVCWSAAVFDFAVFARENMEGDLAMRFDFRRGRCSCTVGSFALHFNVVHFVIISYKK